MNKQVFVVTNVASINTKAKASLLTAGEIGIFAMNKATLVTERASTTTDAESFSIALGRATGKSPIVGRTLDVTPRKRNFVWTKSPYRAPVKKLWLLSTTCVGVSEYDDFAVKIDARFGADFGGLEVQAKTYHIGGKFANVLALYTEIARIINADAYADVIATASSAGVQLEGKRFGQVIEVGMTYYDNAPLECKTCYSCNIDAQALNDADAGEGTYEQLRKFALEAAPYSGSSYTGMRNIPEPLDEFTALGLNESNTFDFYFLQETNHDQPYEDNGSVYNVYQSILIAVAAGTNFAPFESVITALVGQAARVTV